MVNVKFLIGEVSSYPNSYQQPGADDDRKVNLINVLVKDVDHPYIITDVYPASVNSLAKAACALVSSATAL